MINQGKRFEADWKSSVPPDCKYNRLRDSAQSFGGSNQLRFSSTNPYDHEIYKYPHLFCLEQKSTEQHSMSFDRIGEKSNSPPMIKSYQLEGLLSASQFSGVFAGFILNFRSSAKTYYIPIQEFLSFANSTAKKSINEKDIAELSFILIKQTLRRTRYSFDVSQFLSDCVAQFSNI
jgi:penicillin-binding protein-related factor A (putative recombinase)